MAYRQFVARTLTESLMLGSGGGKIYERAATEVWVDGEGKAARM